MIVTLVSETGMIDKVHLREELGLNIKDSRDGTESQNAVDTSSQCRHLNVYETAVGVFGVKTHSVLIGKLAQLVQSICLTSRGSLVRIQYFPLKNRTATLSGQNF